MTDSPIRLPWTSATIAGVLRRGLSVPRIDLIRMLQVLLVASIVLPVLVFLCGSYLAYFGAVAICVEMA